MADETPKSVVLCGFWAFLSVGDEEAIIGLTPGVGVGVWVLFSGLYAKAGRIIPKSGKITPPKRGGIWRGWVRVTRICGGRPPADPPCGAGKLLFPAPPRASVRAPKLAAIAAGWTAQRRKDGQWKRRSVAVLTRGFGVRGFGVWGGGVGRRSAVWGFGARDAHLRGETPRRPPLRRGETSCFQRRRARPCARRSQRLRRRLDGRRGVKTGKGNDEAWSFFCASFALPYAFAVIPER